LLLIQMAPAMMMILRYVKLLCHPYLCQPGKLMSPKGAAMAADNTMFEKHYRVGELAELWSLGRETVRKLVKDDPGVIKVRMGRKKAHTVYSVPESVAQRTRTPLLNAG